MGHIQQALQPVELDRGFIVATACVHLHLLPLHFERGRLEGYSKNASQPCVFVPPPQGCDKNFIRQVGEAVTGIKLQLNTGKDFGPALLKKKVLFLCCS